MVVCQNKNGISKNLRKQIWDVGREKISDWEKTLNETQNWQNVQEKRNIWLLWTEECRSANDACPRMRVNSVWRVRQRDKRGVVGRILRRSRWRKGIHWRRLATHARCRSNTTIVECSTRNISSRQRRSGGAVPRSKPTRKPAADGQRLLSKPFLSNWLCKF